jgi:transcriptional accessory protein Tex/SPT6
LKREDTIDTLWDVDDDNDDDDDDGAREKLKGRGAERWANLNPAVKGRLIKEGQEKAIRNKKKREPKDDRKRRLYFRYKDMLRKEKQERFVTRKLPLKDPSRVPLSSIKPNDTFTGQVISMNNFGAYIDVGTEVDGLLHVSQMSREQFVHHPREMLSLGDEVEVRVVRANPDMKKFQLSMLPESVLEEEMIRKNFEDSEDDERIQLDEVFVDDELWGEIRRVTDFGAYVELGAVVRGFLHFMDHPMWEDHRGSPPSEFMKVGDRIRVWVSGVDETQRRIKLTALRPEGLPGPRREIKWI